MMQKGRRSSIVRGMLMCTVAMFITFASGCGVPEEEQRIIEAETIERISVEMYDLSKKNWEGDAAGQVAEIINNAKLTKKESVQDAPDKTPLGKIIINDSEELIYYYTEGEKTCLEKPYEGIYELSEDIDAYFSNL